MRKINSGNFQGGGGWGGGPDPTARKQSGHFFCPQLILQLTEGVQWIYTEKKTILFQGSRGGTIFFRGGVQLFPGGGGFKC